jgi:hypothetical protein
MTLNQKKIDQLLGFVKARYPDWKDFSNASFAEDEITYKVEASENAKKTLKKETLQTYLDTNDTKRFIRALEQIAQSTNLLFLGAPRTGDLSILYEEKVNKIELCNAIFDLFYGEGPVDARLSRYLAFIDQKDVNFKWTFPTYFLYLLFPETEIIVKPSTTRWFLNFVGSDIGYSNQTDIKIYQTFRGYADELKLTLADSNPQSMMDIQAMLYISAKVATGKEGGMVSAQKRREFKRL